MFRCQLTNRLSQPGEKQFRLVIKSRPKTYWEWRVNEEARKKEFVEVGHGRETVKELLVSEAGLARWEEMTEEHRVRFAE